MNRLLKLKKSDHGWYSGDLFHLIKGNHRALFLPQVATEQYWDLETTLSHLAYKAGLGLDGWTDSYSDSSQS